MSKQNILIFALLSTFITICLFAQQELPKAGKYRVVPEESQLQIEAGTAGVLGFMGHGHTIQPKAFTGEMTLHPQEAVPASVSIRIDATSLQETADFKPEDKKTIEKQLHGEVLETAKYSEITFQSSNVRYSMSAGHVFDVQIEGDLALHGVTRKVTVPARVTDDGKALRATGKFKINRKDYNIETKSAGGGTVKVDKDLEISFNLALKQ